jgi:hypothetical protein
MKAQAKVPNPQVLDDALAAAAVKRSASMRARAHAGVEAAVYSGELAAKRLIRAHRTSILTPAPGRWLPMFL